MGGLVIAAPSSGAGKTTVTLGILRALWRLGVAVRGAKSGPDYIDPRFLEAASGGPCVNLDAFAMGEARLRALAGGPGTLIVEGAMGLFDGAPPDGRGATAEVARVLGLPVILVIDVGGMAQSAGPLAAGFAHADAGVRVAGVILNKVGSSRHAGLCARAVAEAGLPVLGALPRRADLTTPSRHLGLVGAAERPDLDAFLDRAAQAAEEGVDLAALLALAGGDLRATPGPRTRPPAQSIAVARDAAFAFAYPHLLDDWRAGGADLAFFSPLADERVPAADLVVLPGGYPELHAGRLASAATFMRSLRRAAETAEVYGECGGYMVMGEALVDAGGTPHAMAGLLPLATSFARRRLHLGYRTAQARAGPFAGLWAGHEFHYATSVRAEGEPLFDVWDAEGTELPPAGLRRGRASGSFVHLIDRMA